MGHHKQSIVCSISNNKNTFKPNVRENKETPSLIECISLVYVGTGGVQMDISDINQHDKENRCVCGE